MKFPANYFIEIDKLLLNFIWKGKRPRIAEVKLEDVEREKEE